jgi:hypothetical protein
METLKNAPKKAEGQKFLQSSKNVETTVKEKKESVIAFIEKHKPTPLTAEQRIERIKQFEALSQRFKILKEKDNDLKMFTAGNDKTNAKIVFKNNLGFEFIIQNTNVIEKLIEAGKMELSILLNEAENEILTFEI